jgi:hypothetical protein
MITRTKIGSFRATWVLRHRWEPNSNSMIENYEANNIRTKWQLGIWASRSRVVGPTRRGSDRDKTIKKTFSDSNLINSYMIGLNLIVCKVWVNFTFRPTFGSK